MSKLKLISLNNNSRLKALEKLGYGINENGFVICKNTKEELICKYSHKKIHLDDAAILPGSVIVINANLLTMAEYFLDRDNEGV